MYPADCTSNPYAELSKTKAPTAITSASKRQKLFNGAFVSGGIVGGDTKQHDDDVLETSATTAMMNDSAYTRWAMAADPTKARPMPGYMCRNCGRDDHYLRDCPQGKQTR